MAQNVTLLLMENVENCGIVGDVVSVRPGYARNYLMPRGLATHPSEELIQQLAERRAEAELQLAKQRKHRETMIQKLEGFEITLERACNDQGHLYGSVTQQDIASALVENEFAVRARDVRLSHTVKRIDSYEVLIKPEQDLEATIKLWVVADRDLELDDEREEMEFDNEGNLIHREPKASKTESPESGDATSDAGAAEKAEATPADS